MNTCFACNDFTIWGVAAFLCAAIAVVDMEITIRKKIN